MAKYKQGVYKPTNPQKYEGDLSNIIYRSGWEKRFMEWCDMKSNILKWSSEETIIPYRCSTDDKLHRYFVDFKITVKTTTGQSKIYLVEIKPYQQTKPPKFPGRQTKRYITESLTFMKNQSKWMAAREYCNSRGWKFKIITEKELGIRK